MRRGAGVGQVLENSAGPKLGARCRVFRATHELWAGCLVRRCTLEQRLGLALGLGLLDLLIQLVWLMFWNQVEVGNLVLALSSFTLCP